jgi:ribosomal protein S1
VNNSHDPWFDADKKLIRGSKHQVIAINKYDYGILVEFKEGVIGLVRKADMEEVSLNDVDIGACLLVSILWVDVIQKKLQLC